MKTLRRSSPYFLPVAAVVFLCAPLSAKPTPPKPSLAPKLLPGVVSIGGQVMGPDGKPVKGAQVAFFGDEGSLDSKPQIAVTDVGGKFTLSVPNKSVAASGKVTGRLLIMAPGLATTNGILQKMGNVFHLEKGRTLSGTVVDEAGKPVSNAQVHMLIVIRGQDMEQSLDLMNIGALRERFAAKSGVNGQWRIAGLPADGRAVVELEDAAYAHALAEKELDSDLAPLKPLVAKPAARLTGRVLLSGNKPAVGLMVSATGVHSNGSAQTDKNGRYVISGLDSGSFSLTARDLTDEWVGSEITGVKAQSGKTSQAPDIVLGHGLLLEGTVIDADTGGSIKGAVVGTQGTQGFTLSTPSDEKGRYRVRVSPGDVHIYPYSIPSEYIKDDEAAFRINAQPGQKPLAPLRLHRGLTLSGIATDEAGTPAVGAKLFVGNEWDGVGATVDETGKWQMSGVPTEKYGAGKGQVRFSVGGDWQFVQPQTAKPPFKAPLRFVLRRIALASLRGRVVGTDGEPIAGAALQLRIALGQSQNGWRYERRTSDAQGNFSATKLRPDNQIAISAQKEGYKFIKGGTVTKKGSIFIATDIVFAPLSATFTGRVLDADGTPVSGAKVLAPGTDSGIMATTDANGHFSIPSLPAGKVRVMAARGYDVGEVTGETDGTTHSTIGANDIKLVAKSTPPLEGKEFVVAFLEKLKLADDESDRDAVPSLAKWLASSDPDTALRLSIPKDGDVDDALAEIITTLSRHNPLLAEQWAPAQLANIKDADLRLGTSLELGIGIASLNPKEATELLQEARSLIKPTDVSEEAASTYSSMAVLAARLGRPEARSLVDLMVQALAASKGQEKADAAMADYAETIAEGGADLVRYMVSDLKPKDEIRSLERAMPRVSTRDVPGARSLLKDMEAAMKVVGPIPEQDANDEDGMYNPTPDQSYAVAVYSLIQAMGPEEAATALALARQTKETPYTSYSKANMLLLSARLQPPATALQVLQDAMDEAAKSESESTDTAAHIAAVAHELDPQKGDEFFAQVRKRFRKADLLDEELITRPSIAPYAFYHASLDPAESRLLLEAEWARRSGAEKKVSTSDDADDSLDADRRMEVAQAMVAVDVSRALEMAHALSNEEEERTQLYDHIIHFLLASPTERRVMPFRGSTDSDD